MPPTPLPCFCCHSCTSTSLPLLAPQHLVLALGADGELEANAAAGQFSVDLAVGVESVVNTTALLLVKDDLQHLAAVLLGADTLANNLDWVDNIGKDGVVDSSQSSGSWSLLSLGGSGSVGSLGAGKDTALSQEENVSVRELLLEFTGQSSTSVSIYGVLDSRFRLHWTGRGSTYRC